MRLIDADALRAEYQAILDRGDMFCEYDIIGMVDNAPTIEITDYDTGYQDGLEDGLNDIRPQGEWIFGSTLGHGWMKCSNCCVSQSGQTLCWSFCPNCGADMRVKSELNDELNELKEADDD